MTKAYDRIKVGLVDAIAIAKGESEPTRVYVFDPIDIAAARKKLGMSQDVFAFTFGISAGTLRGWEQGRRRPEGPARVLLRVIDKEPEAVKRALAKA